jgi:hypothetical protein
MQVKNRLTGIGAAIDDNTITAFCDSKLLG